MRFALILSLLCWSQIHAACHPKADWLHPQYIVGYGSLMFEASKQKTILKSGQNYPIQLRGYQRSWLVKGYFLSHPTTFLGVKENLLARMNAVIFQIYQPDDLSLLDLRERGYCRRKIDPQNIKILKGQKPQNAEYWIYVPEKKVRHYPNKSFPISLYYANIFISGCLELEEKFHLPGFSQECFATTDAWSAQVNPFYPSVHLSVDKLGFWKRYRDYLGTTSLGH